MDSSTDTTVEAALLAIGSELTWQGFDDDQEFLGSAPEQEYQIFCHDDGWITRFLYGYVEDGPTFSTCKAAQAACERHYATGEWD